MSRRSQSKPFILLLSDDERRRLDAEASTRGVSRADVIRLLLRGALPAVSAQ